MADKNTFQIKALTVSILVVLLNRLDSFRVIKKAGIEASFKNGLLDVIPRDVGDNTAIVTLEVEDIVQRLVE